MTYEKIELIKPENYVALLAVLRERTGLEINAVKWQGDFLLDIAEINILLSNDDHLTITEK